MTQTAVVSLPSPSADRLPTLRRYFARVIFWSAAPLVLLLAVLAVMRVADLREDIRQEARAVAVRMASIVDLALEGRVLGLQALAATVPAGDLDEPGWPAFHERARAFQRAYGSHVVLGDGARRMLINTREPFGTLLPPVPVPKGRAALPAALASGEPVVGDLFVGPVAGTPLVAIAVPVPAAEAGGRPERGLMTTLAASDLQRYLQLALLPPGWALTLRDGTAAAVAWRFDPDPALAADGLARLADDAGARVEQPLQRAPWRIEVTVPRAAYVEPVLAAVVALLLAAAVAVAAAALGGLRASRPLVRSIRGLAGMDAPLPAPVAEIDAVRAQLERERDARRAAEAELAAAARRHRKLFESNPLPMWLFDPRTLRVVDVNRAAERQYGYSRHEFLGLTITDLRPASERPALQQALRLGADAPAGEPEPIGVFTHQRRDGSLFEAEVTRSVLDFDGEELRLVLAHDVTERCRAERALRESEREFRLLAEQIPGIVYRARLDALGTTEYVSPRVSELGFTPQQWIEDPQAVWRAVHPDDRERVMAEVTEALASGRERMHLNYRMRCPGDRWRHASDHVQVVRPAQGDPFLLGINIDVSGQVESERALASYRDELQQLTQRLMTQERETAERLAQALHDRAGQSLAVARLHLDQALVGEGASMAPALHGHCRRLGQDIDQALAEVREVLGELRPPMLAERGLAAALEAEVDRRLASAGHADLWFEATPGVRAQRWPDAVEYALFMIAREAVVNALRHAGAGLIQVRLGGGARRAALVVEDDGRGIGADVREGRPGHLGVVGMRERARAIGAHFELEALVAGGTRLVVRWDEQ